MSNRSPLASTSHPFSSSAPTSSTNPPLDVDPASAPPILDYLPSNVGVYRCATCSAELTLQDELVSRAFSGSSGPAYLVRSTINTFVGPKATKQLLTGRHVVSPLMCKGCQTEIGWTYFVAPDNTQRYKEGKSILEKDKIYKDNKWRV